MTRGRALLLGMLLIAAAFGVWRLMRSDDPRVDDDSIEGAAGRESVGPAVLPSPLAAGGDSTKPQAHDRGPRERERKDDKPGVAPAKPNTVRLSIRMPSGVTTDGAEVLVFDPRVGAMTGRFPVAANGTVAVELAPELMPRIDSVQWLILPSTGTLVVALPGRPPVAVPIDALLLGRDTTVEVPEGVPLAGRVVDGDGKPLATTTIVATTVEPAAYAYYDENVRLDAALSARRVAEVVRAKTDADGRFELRVSKDKGFWLEVDDDAWLLSPSGDHPTSRDGERGITVRALPAMTFRSRVTDAGTGGGVSNTYWKVAYRGEADSFSFGYGFPTPDVRITFRLDHPVGRALEVDASVSASGPAAGTDSVAASGGYVPQDVPLRFNAGETSIRRDVRLSRAAAVGRADLTYEITEGGRPADWPVYLEAHVASDKEAAAVSFVGLKPVGRGRYAATLASGEWNLVLRVRQPLQDLISRRDRVALAPGEAKTIAAAFSATGGFTVNWPWGGRSDWTLSLADVSGAPSYSSGTSAKGSAAFAAVPAGRWHFAIAAPGGAPRFERDVEVTAGSTQAIDLPGPK